MHIIVILVCLVAALLILIPLLEKYQGKMGLDKAQKYGKYILPLAMLGVVVNIIHSMMQS
ncbi:hypothetical protein N473_24270 [Pseudoalteromonas luteoviolacea CPMOR-1]|uniref:Uncharacterized protein n=2 Tax=Pseudoalteromonas luteoviolacea TaxID=43657 RepID=A0A161Y1P5_9GAMM|nr:hypothetical protein [Pseudoalteromonas luteoviolacea]KID54749.1 hypothetical protein JF50_23000 [Pseudoalteromonas luteoviolacea]KZN60471.1 hypothetical protein N473_24270 [Pseudoalteromonas luteoviolacea CPMOR-1]